MGDSNTIARRGLTPPPPASSPPAPSAPVDTKPSKIGKGGIDFSSVVITDGQAVYNANELIKLYEGKLKDIEHELKLPKSYFVDGFINSTQSNHYFNSMWRNPKIWENKNIDGAIKGQLQKAGKSTDQPTRDSIGTYLKADRAAIFSLVDASDKFDDDIQTELMRRINESGPDADIVRIGHRLTTEIAENMKAGSIKAVGLFHVYVTIDLATMAIIRQQPPALQAKLLVDKASIGELAIIREDMLSGGALPVESIEMLSGFYRTADKKTQDEMKKLDEFSKIIGDEARTYYNLAKSYYGPATDLKTIGYKILHILDHGTSGDGLPNAPFLQRIEKFWKYDPEIQRTIRKAVAKYADISPPQWEF